MKSETPFSTFDAVDIRVGKIVNVEDSLAKKPTYRISADFGAEIGVKTTCAGFRNYTKEDLIGKHILGVVNLPPKKVGPELSEFLLLGVSDAEGKAIYITPQAEVATGTRVF